MEPCRHRVGPIRKRPIALLLVIHLFAGEKILAFPLVAEPSIVAALMRLSHQYPNPLSFQLKNDGLIILL